MRGSIRSALFLVALLPVVVSAQDVHFSQLDFHPILINAAFAGTDDYTARLGAAYRNQWASVSDPYSTFAFVADAPLWHSRYRRNGLAIGAAFCRDRAGTLNYGTSSVAAMLSYCQGLDWTGVNRLSAGIELSYSRLGYDPSDATLFDTQEQLPAQHKNYISVGCGVAWLFEPDDRWFLRVGLSAHHLNRPNISLFDDEESLLEPRWLTSVRLFYMLADHWQLSSVALLQWQHDARETCLGGDVRWIYDSQDPHYFSVAVGATYRTADAWILSLSADYRALQFIFCYDANVSDLSHASSGYGAIEMGVAWRFYKSKVVHRKALPCPIM